MPDPTILPNAEREGWGDRRPGDRVFHYFVNSMSLCGRVGFYFGELSPDNDGTEPQRSDCKSCFKALIKRREEKANA